MDFDKEKFFRIAIEKTRKPNPARSKSYPPIAMERIVAAGKRRLVRDGLAGTENIETFLEEEFLKGCLTNCLI